jgi:hypothetical protein
MTRLEDLSSGPDEKMRIPLLTRVTSFATVLSGNGVARAQLRAASSVPQMRELSD